MQPNQNDIADKKSSIYGFIIFIIILSIIGFKPIIIQRKKRISSMVFLVSICAAFSVKMTTQYILSTKDRQKYILKQLCFILSNNVIYF